MSFMCHFKIFPYIELKNSCSQINNGEALFHSLLKGEKKVKIYPGLLRVTFRWKCKYMLHAVLSITNMTAVRNQLWRKHLIIAIWIICTSFVIWRSSQVISIYIALNSNELKKISTSKKAELQSTHTYYIITTDQWLFETVWGVWINLK